MVNLNQEINFVLNTYGVFFIPLLIIVLLIIFLINLVNIWFYKKKIKLRKSVYISFFLIILIAPIFFSYLFLGLSKIDCSIDEMQPIVSEYNYSAQVISTNCGATSSFSTQVILEKQGGDKATIFFYEGHPKSLILDWINDKELQVGYKGGPCKAWFEGSKVVPNKSDLKDIKIIYTDSCESEK